MLSFIFKEITHPIAGEEIDSLCCAVSKPHQRRERERERLLSYEKTDFNLVGKRH